jgi:hypothetical protein
MPQDRAGLAALPRLRLVAAIFALSREIVQPANIAVGKVVLERMGICLWDTRKAEGDQDQRDRKPAQDAAALAFRTCLPLVSHHDHSVLRATRSPRLLPGTPVRIDTDQARQIALSQGNSASSYRKVKGYLQ